MHESFDCDNFFTDVKGRLVRRTRARLECGGVKSMSPAFPRKSYMKIRALLVAALFLFSTHASAQTTFGGPDCGEWIKSPTHSKRVWLAGYLSGLNMQHSLDEKKPTDPLGKLSSAEQAFLWVDNYCKENPLKDVPSAGALLFFELIR